MRKFKPTEQYQHDLASFCRTGDYTPIPGVNEKNISKYRELIYNVVDDSLTSAYPLTHNLLEKEDWDQLVHEFFSQHKCQSPQIWQMPKELYEYVKETGHPLLNKYPFIIDLLLFEWMEIEVYMMEDMESDPSTLLGNYIIDDLVLNPEIRILSLQYPVHLQNATQITNENKNQYYVCVHRDPESGRVHFTDIQYPHLEIIEQLSKKEKDYQTLLKIFTKYASPEMAGVALNNFIEASLESKLFLGFGIINQN